MSVGETVIRWVGIGMGLGFGLAVAGAAAQVLQPPDARVQHQAESPLRWVIEASKLKARGRLAETAAPLPPSRTARPVARRAAAPPVPAAALAAASPRLAATAEPAAAELSAPAAPVAAAAALARDTPDTLELLSGDAPNMPAQMLADLQADAVLELALIVLADGSVDSVTTVSSTHPELDEQAMAAVRAWRFKPVAQAQMRHVELVFHPAR